MVSESGRRGSLAVGWGGIGRTFGRDVVVAAAVLAAWLCGCVPEAQKKE